MTTYNLFRHRDRPELICAVPEDAPVPAFIIGPPWELAGGIDDATVSSVAFDREAAGMGARYNGFYLFQLINASDLQLFARRGSARDSARGTPARPGPLVGRFPSARNRSRTAAGQSFDSFGDQAFERMAASL